ncbi:MAG TPA: hypothetical protein VFE50_13940 [Cyclobacteriaceae bacterium]|nr:hypothetical protein [Cyclobacteriaceae bacterium]
MITLYSISTRTALNGCNIASDQSLYAISSPVEHYSAPLVFHSVASV